MVTHYAIEKVYRMSKAYTGYTKSRTYTYEQTCKPDKLHATLSDNIIIFRPYISKQRILTFPDSVVHTRHSMYEYSRGQKDTKLIGATPKPKYEHLYFAVLVPTFRPRLCTLRRAHSSLPSIIASTKRECGCPVPQGAGCRDCGRRPPVLTSGNTYLYDQKYNTRLCFDMTIIHVLYLQPA